MNPRAPDSITALEDRYRMERELGRGGMATVYLATDLKLERQVALKVLRPELGATLGSERFLREIAIAARLNHPHILTLHDSGESGGHLYYAMPYVEGESLRQRLEREGQLSIAEVIAIVQAVAGALSYAHQQGIIHRDIKPENILLSRGSDGVSAHPLVVDFGIARALDVAGGERLTETGLALGTPAYMSPEQAAAGRLDNRSDIYALGCVTYEMLAGQPPFTGPTAQAILARHAVDPVPPLHTVRSTVAPAIESAIEQALAKVPADRFATADEFATALTAKHVPAPRRRALRSRMRVLLGVFAAAGTAGIGAAILKNWASAVVSPAATSMAVLPFVTATGDTSLARLGKDLAVTLSASLDGVGGIKTTDRLAIANATAGKPALSTTAAASLARRLGASSLLRGTLVGVGDKVRLDLGLYSTDAMAPLAEGISVNGHRDSIGTLTDSASWALLRQLWQRGVPPSPSLSAVTTKSLPALRAFLEGERDLGLNQWDQAALAYKSAITADSGFALAYFNYALARWWWSDAPFPPEAIEALRRRQQSLPQRERLLVEAFLTTPNTPRVKAERHREVVRRYPDYWPGWFLYADALYHWGPIAGFEWTEGLEAFRRVVKLNPDLVPAWEHLFHLTIGRDQEEASRAYNRLVELGWPTSANPGLVLITHFEGGMNRTGGRVTPELGPLADSVAAFMVSGRGPDDIQVEGAPLGQLQLGFPAAQLELNHRALQTRNVPANVKTALRAANAWAWAARGQWDSALTTMKGLAETRDVAGVQRLAYQNHALAVLGAVLGVSSPADVDKPRRAVVAHIKQLSEPNDLRFWRAWLAWYDGLLGFARRDRAAIQTSRREARAIGWKQADLVDRSLAAFEHALSGDRKRAGHELAELEEYCVAHQDCGSMIPHIAVQRLFSGQWLQEAGELEKAQRLLRWQDAPWVGWPWTPGDALAGPTLLTRARIEEALGAKPTARMYYEQFLRRYDQPMPSEVHLVNEAKAALARLQPD